MTTNKSKNSFMWSELAPMKWMQVAEYRQLPYEAELRYTDYDKEAPRREICDIKPQFRSSLNNTPNLQDYRWQTMSEKSEFRMKGFRHSKLNT